MEFKMIKSHIIGHVLFWMRGGGVLIQKSWQANKKTTLLVFPIFIFFVLHTWGYPPHPRSYVPTPFIQIMQDNFNEEWSFLRNKEKFF